MNENIVFIEGKDKLLELGFEQIGKYGYTLKTKEYNNYFTFFESKNNDEYILDILDSSFPNNQNVYNNLYNFILDNKDKPISFWSYSRTLSSGLELNGLSNYFIDSKDGNVVGRDVKVEHTKYLGSLFKSVKNILNVEDTEAEDRVFYPISFNDIVEPMIKILEYVRLVDLELEDKDQEMEF